MLEAEIIYIGQKEYEALCDAENRLRALEKHGVDKWEGYQEAMKEYFKEKFID